MTATEKGQTIWSGPVAVKAGERVIVDLNHNGALKTKDFKAGMKLSGPEPRFEAGVASARVPIAPVTAQLSAQANQGDLRGRHAIELEISRCGGYVDLESRECLGERRARR